MLKHHKKAAAASVLCLSLLLSACGNNDKGNLDKVQFDLKNATAEPSASFEQPFAATADVSRTLEEGNGESIEDGDTILLKYAVINGENGKVENSNHKQSPTQLPMDDRFKQLSPKMYEQIKKLKVGGSFAFSSNRDRKATPSADSDAHPTVSPGTATAIEVYTIAGKVAKEPSGTEQPVDPSLPSFTYKDGKAEVKLPENKGEEPKELVSKDLITGNGKKVEENDTVYVRYVGVRWSDGKVFDGNFEGNKPIAELSLQGVVPGMTKGLAGKTVGSRVELVIPTDLAYRNQGPSEAQGPLVFVVDILGAANDPSAAQKKQQAEEYKKQLEKAASASANPSGGAAPSQSPAPSGDGSASASASPAATEQKPSESASTK